MKDKHKLSREAGGEAGPGVAALQPWHRFGTAFSTWLFALGAACVLSQQGKGVTSCSSGSSWRARGKGGSGEELKDHTCLLISLRLFHPSSCRTSQLCLRGHSSHECLSVVHSIVPPVACKTFPKNRWAAGLAPLVLFTFLKPFQCRKKPQPAKPQHLGVFFLRCEHSRTWIPKFFSRSLHTCSVFWMNI